MSVTTCALSGQPLIEPVVSSKSGHVFEKSLILKQISMTGQCPITGQNLDATTDLIVLKVAVNVAPKPLESMSFPSTLNFLQSQWDTQMLEVYQLRQTLEQTRKELSHALYQHDAACQVICRLEGDKEQLLAQLDQNQAKFEEMKDTFENQARQMATVSDVNMPEESKQIEAPTTLSQALIDRMNALSDQLIEQRKQQKPPATYPQREDIANFREAKNGTIRATTKGSTVDTLDISTAPSGAILVTTSTNDIKIMDKSGALSESIPIDKRVKLAKFAPNSDSIAIFAFRGQDGAAQVWNLKQKKMVYEIQSHSAEISDVCFMPLEGLVAVSSMDKTWSLHDYSQSKELMKRSETVKITSIRFHPDGLIMAIGLANGKIMIYDVRDMVMAQELEGPTPSSAVSQLEFSNKGIFLAASWTGSSSCRVYSLHKGFACNELTQEGMPVTAISFDLYGGFLAVGTEQNMIVSSYKNWKKILTTLRPHTTGVSAIRFDASGRKMFVSSQANGEVKTLSLA